MVWAEDVMAGRMGSAVIMDNAVGGDGFIAAVNFFCDHVGGVSFAALAACTKLEDEGGACGGVVAG